MEEENGNQYFISTTYEIQELFRDEIEKQRLAQIELEKQRLEQIELEKSKPEIIINKDNYSINTDDKNIRIKMSLQKGNKLVVNTFYKDDLINTEEFDIKREDFTYEYKPLIGESKIQFKLIDSNNNVKTEEITVSYIPRDLAAELSIKDKVISIDNNGEKSIKIKLKVEKNSTLFVETYVDGQLINTERFEIKKKNFVYEYVPKSEKSKLNFKLVDKHNNVKTEQVIVSHSPINEELAVVLSDIKSFDNKSFSSITQLKEVLNANSIEELINLIYAKSSENELSKKQAQALIIALALTIDKNTPLFISDLQKLAKEDDLKTVLDSIYDNKSNFKTNLDVIKELILKSESNDYTNNDIIKLLEDYLIASNRPIDEILEELNKLIGTDISDILNKLNSSVIDIISIDDLKKHIESNNIYLEKELQRIYALMEGMLISSNAALEINDIRKAPEKDIEPESEKNNFVIFYIITAGILLGIFIIFLNRRKNKGNKKSSE